MARNEDCGEIGSGIERAAKARYQLAEAQRIAHLGSWEWSVGGAPVNWSDELFRIAGRSFQEGPPSFDEYIGLIHPEDRERVLNVRDVQLERAVDLLKGLSLYSRTPEKAKNKKVAAK